MRNRSHGCVRVFVLVLLLEVLLIPICHAEVTNDIHRTKREILVRKIENRKHNAKEVPEVNLRHEESQSDRGKSEPYLRGKREAARSSSSSVDHGLQRLNVEKSAEEKADYAEEAEDEMTGRREHDEDEGTSNLVRLPRDVSADLKYTDQDERSSLYDDYEVKDVAKRGAEDYEEMDEDSLRLLEAAVQDEESADVEKREMHSDARVKRNQAASSGSLRVENVESGANDLSDSERTRSDVIASKLRLDSGSLGDSKIVAGEPYPVSNVETSGKFNEQIFSNNGMSDKLEESKANEEVSSGKSTSAEDYEKLVEERIQRKIDSIKDDIRRDIEAQRRIRDIQENNAKFDELQDEESENLEENPVEKRRSVAKKRSARDADAIEASSNSADEKRSTRGKQREKPQIRRSSEHGKSSNDLEKRSSRENPKKRIAAKRDESSNQSPSKEVLKKKRERVRETILVRNDRHRAKKRHLTRNYAQLSSEKSEGKLGDQLSADRDLNSYLRGNDEMIQTPVRLVNEDDDSDGKRSAAGRANSLVSLTGSSQELNPRLAKEYKEAFGGLQSEPGNSLARFKRIKRVLGGPDAKI